MLNRLFILLIGIDFVGCGSDEVIQIEDVTNIRIEQFRDYEKNDSIRSIPFEKVKGILKNIQNAKSIGPTKFLPKYGLYIQLHNDSVMRYRMTSQSFKLDNDWSYEFEIKNYADTLWKLGYKY